MGTLQSKWNGLVAGRKGQGQGCVNSIFLRTPLSPVELKVEGKQRAQAYRAKRDKAPTHEEWGGEYRRKDTRGKPQIITQAA